MMMRIVLRMHQASGTVSVFRPAGRGAFFMVLPYHFKVELCTDLR
jgi:hypothetical protein